MARINSDGKRRMGARGRSPTSNSSVLSDRISFPMGLRDVHGCSRFTEMDNAWLVTVRKIEDRKNKSPGGREREKEKGERFGINNASREDVFAHNISLPCIWHSNSGKQKCSLILFRGRI